MYCAKRASTPNTARLLKVPLRTSTTEIAKETHLDLESDQLRAHLGDERTDELLEEIQTKFLDQLSEPSFFPFACSPGRGELGAVWAGTPLADAVSAGFDGDDGSEGAEYEEHKMLN